jgi:hypothetical protein
MIDSMAFGLALYLLKWLSGELTHEFSFPFITVYFITMHAWLLARKRR